jgi:hypothetical protein
MTIEFYDGTDHDGLFDVLGKVFYAQSLVNTATGTTVHNGINAILTQAQTLSDSLNLNIANALSSASTADQSFAGGGSGAVSLLQQAASALLVQIVNADAPQADQSEFTAIKELIRQMVAESESVDASTVSASVAAVGSPAGDGVILSTMKSGNGLACELAIAETINVACIATGNRSSLRFVAAAAVNQLDAAWPDGSGTISALTALQGTDGILSNGEFDAETRYDNIPDDWTVIVGTAGSTILMTDVEVQTVAIAGGPTSGYYLLHWTNRAGHTQTTSPIPFDADAGTLQSAIRELTGLEGMTVTSSGTSPNFTHTITFAELGGNVGQFTSTNRMSGATTTVNEIQRIAISGNPDGGTFTLTYAGQTTAGIAWNASASTIATALIALSNIDAMTGTGGPMPNATASMEFGGSLASTDVAEMTINVGSLTKTAPSVTVATTTQGNAGTNEVQRVRLFGTPTGGNFTLSVTANGSTQTTANIAYNANAAAIDSALEGLSNLDNVAVSGGPLPGAFVDITFQGNAASADIPLMTANCTGLTGGSIYADVATTTPGSGGGAIASGVVESWHLEEEPGESRVGEVLGMELAEAGTVDTNTGVSGVDLLFTGTGDLNTAAESDLATDDSFSYSLSAWVKLPATGVSGRVELQTVATLGGSLSLQLLSDGIGGDATATAAGGPGTVDSATLYPVDEWHLLVAKYDRDAEEIGISVDGEAFETAASLGGITTSATARLLVSGSADTEIDEITFWERALSDSEAATLWSGGTGWTSRTSAADNDWRSVAYGNGLFVAVSYDGTGNRVMTSPDGITWTSRTSVDRAWYSVAYGNGLFVAVSYDGTGNRVMTSPDGITWTSRTSAADNDWRSVAYGNGLFVAVSSTGTGNRVMTSPDGITWTSRTSAADNDWFGVTYGNGLFVAVSNTGTGNRVMTSPDGITWTSRTSAADNDWFGVTYGNGLFVAVSRTGTGNRVMTSPDGITWTSRTSAADNDWRSVAYGNGLFVAVSFDGTGNRVMTSPDGITWTSQTSAADNQWFDVAYGNGLFVAVSSSGTGNRVMTSPDGDSKYYPFGDGTDEVQSLTTAGTPTQGSFTLTFDGETTTSLAFDATASQVQSALLALSTIGGSNVACTGGPLPTAITITFQNSLGSQNVSEITVDDTLLKSLITTQTPGAGPTNEVQSFTLGPDVTGGTYTLSWDNGSGSQTTAGIAWNANATEIRSALEATSTIAPGDVAVGGGPSPAAVTVTFQGAYAGTNVAAMTGSGASLTQNAITGSVVTLQDGSPDSGSITHLTTVPGTPQVYSGAKALIYTSNGSELTSIQQRLTRLQSNTVYGLHLWACCDDIPSAGVIKIELIDGTTGSVINDDDGTPNALTFNADDLLTTWQSLDDLVTGDVVFRTPLNVPSIVYLRLRISTAVTSGKSIFFDRFTMAPMTQLYAGGPFVQVIDGRDSFELGDAFELTVTNNRAGLVQEWFGRNFNMAQLGLLLPSNSAGSETIPDSVVG